MTEGLRNRRFEALTGLRALAAYLVYFHHFTPDAPVVGRQLNAFLRQGYVGVSLFFVLSGFLIALRYYDRAELQAGFLRDYFHKRLVRIYPLYVVLTLVTLFYQRETSLSSWFLELTLLKGFSADLLFHGIPQAWSLTVEETFYLLAPLLFVANRRGVSLAGLAAAVYGVGAGLFALAAGLDLGEFFRGFRLFAIYSFFGRCFEFLLGVALFKLFRYGRTVPRGLTYFSLAGFVGLTYSLSLFPSLGLFAPGGMQLYLIVIPLAAAGLIAGLAFEATALSRVLSAPMSRLLGNASYGFYLVHSGIIADHFWSEQSGILSHFLAMNLVAIGLYLGFERPVHAWLSQRWIRVSLKPSIPN